MALFEHVIMLKQDLSTADLDSELKKHEEFDPECTFTPKISKGS